MTLMDEAKLTQKLRLIEALYAGAKTAGEKDAPTGPDSEFSTG